MPNSVYADFGSFIRLLERNGFPAVFAGTSGPAAPPVAAPNPGAIPGRVLAAAEPSVLKIVALEPQCGQQTEGSGFMYAPGHVLTNAHVVAGAHSVRIVQDGTGASIDLPATVVLFDPNRDVAVLDVPGLTRPAMRVGGAGATGDPAEVLGYPENGGFSAQAARIAARQTVSSPNIYSDAVVDRDVYAIRALVRPGNSGGPLLGRDGTVYGMVFAASTTEPDTGYALTAAEVGRDATAGASATSAVGTDNCT
jgi:S1-C subfamily serine protease